MNKINENREGYKETKLGWIPEDWREEIISEAFEICNNLRLPISETERKKMQGNYPYYGPTKIQDYINEYRIDGTFALIGEDGDHFLKWKEQPMTLLVSGKFNVNNHAHIVRGKNNLTEWFYYYFNHRPLTPYLTRQGAGRYKLTKDTLGKIPCAIPPLLEQKNIVKCLITWDKAISTTQKLIEKKEQQKKWLMQNLLSGKKRLQGFNVTTTYKKLKPFIKEVSNRNTSNEIANVLSVTNSRGFINQTEQFERIVASKDLTNYKIVRKGQFAYNPSRINVGSLDILRDFEQGLLSPMYVTFDVNEKTLLPEYLYYLLKTHWFIGHIPQFVQGSVRDTLSFDGLQQMSFFIPTIKEQTAILKILQTADDETGILIKKLNRLKVQKKGLMQQLLTGAKRLIIIN